MFKKQTLARPATFSPQVIDEVLATTSVENVEGVVRDIGRNAVTTRAEAIRHQTDEAMIWQATPSLTLLIVPVAAAIVVFLAALIGSRTLQVEIVQAREQMLAQSAQHATPARSAKSARQHTTQQAAPMSDEDALLWLKWIGRTPYLLALVFAMALFWRFVVLKTTRYAATSQRLIVQTGIFLSRSTPHELFDLGDFVIEKPLLLRPFDVGRLKIVGKRVLSNGVPKSMEMPVLIGIHNPDYVRDILRTGGQLEAQRADKLRWR